MGEDYSNDDKLSGRSGQVFGFGDTKKQLADFRSSTSETSFRRTSLRIMSNKACKKKFKEAGAEGGSPTLIAFKCLDIFFCKLSKNPPNR